MGIKDDVELEDCYDINEAAKRLIVCADTLKRKAHGTYNDVSLTVLPDMAASHIIGYYHYVISNSDGIERVIESGIRKGV